MHLAVLALVLAAPNVPQLGEPVDGAWVNGNAVYLWWDPWSDDMGVAPGLSRLEFRRFDGGYGAFNDTQPWSTGRYTSITFPVEAETWCWRAFNINANNETSAPSVERCFRTDNTNPTSPAFVDAGAIVSNGRVVIEHSAAVDAVSGVGGYVLTLSNAPASSPFYDLSPSVAGVPLVTWVGEGTWFGWIKVEDLAFNSNFELVGSYRIPITITAVSTVHVPAAPAFKDTVTSDYGSGLEWDAGAFATNGVTHVVGSVCNIEAGACGWEHAFVGLPSDPADPGAWVQFNGEGTMVARIAVVAGGEVGFWSAQSGPIVVDRTLPPEPINVMVTPRLSNTPTFTVSWSAPSDDRSGLLEAVIVAKHVESGMLLEVEVAVPTNSRTFNPAVDGVYQYRVRSVDRALNVSALSPIVTATLDRSGPTSTPPLASAVAMDGGALVTLTWARPTDELSMVVSQELSEQTVDGGAVEFTVADLTTSRFVGPGTWRWRLRGTDEVGNVGNFSEPSNVIVVTPGGVAQGPAISTRGPFTLRCGAPFSATLRGAGDAPLSWSLISGPPGLTLVGSVLSWVPSVSTSGDFDVVVRLTNNVGFVDKTLVLAVTCTSGDGGSDNDGGSDDDGGATQPLVRRNLAVGCDCSAADAFSLLAGALFLLARRRRT